MTAFLHSLTSHPYLVLLISGLLERLGFPLLFSPIVVAAGALAATGQMHFDLTLWIAFLVSMAGDWLWYEVGRSKGDSVLSTLCRISMEPETCVRRSRKLFEKGIARTILFSKWLPGLSHIVPAMAGLSEVSRQTFIVNNAAGTALWVLVMLLVGYLPVTSAHLAPAIGRVIFEGGVVLLAANVGLKYYQKRRFLRDLYKARITPQDLNRMLQSGEKVVILDLRHPLDSVADPRTLPGAIRVLPEDVTSGAAQLPKDREIVLYCT